jgi:transmembrane sensor
VQLAGRPEIRAATKAAYARGTAARSRQRVRLQIVALCGAAVLAAGIGWRSFSIDHQDFATTVGQRSEIALRDGSTIMLDTDTRLSVRWRARARDVRLERGHAFFTVAHDAAQPFTVRAGDASVVATGTQFDIRRTDVMTSVALLRGGVDVRSAGNPVTHLNPGQQWRIPESGKPLVEPVSSATITAWMDDRILFNNLPLADLLAKVNRNLDRPIVLDAPGYAQARLSGSLKAGDGPAFVAAVTATLPLTTVKDNTGTLHLRDMPDHSPSPAL